MSRNTLSSSLWLGLHVDEPPETAKGQWVQAGLLTIWQKSDAGTGIPQKGYYGEIVLDWKRAQKFKPQQPEFQALVKRSYVLAENGQWKDGRAELKFIDTQFDHMQVRWIPDGTVAGEPLRELRGLRTIRFDTAQAGMEASASVSRVPGVPSNPAVISDMELFYEGPHSEPLRQPTEFTNSNLEIVVMSPKGALPNTNQTFEGWEDIHKDNTKGDINPAQGAIKFLHYNIRLNAGNSISLWDKYEWWNATAIPGKPKTRGFDWVPQP